MGNYISANAAHGDSDSQRIQNAIMKAKAEGVNRVIITPKTHGDSPIWSIQESILLPDDIEIFIDGAHLRLADNTFINMFITENCLGDRREQRNIELHGAKGAVLDGGNYNGLSERNSEKDGRPSIWVNTMLWFYNLVNLSVHDLKIVNQRWWGITNLFVSQASYKNIEFKADISRVDENGVHYPDEYPETYEEIYIKNADGLDLRMGCHDFTIENISGFTEDDTVALTGLMSAKESELCVPDKSPDIHHITIKNVTSDCFTCSNVRLLCEDGVKIHDVSVDHVADTRTDSRYKAVMTVRIGDLCYGRRQSKMGDIYNIKINDVISKGKMAVALCKSLKDSVISNITVEEGCAGFTVYHKAEMDNVSVTNVNWTCY